MNELLAFIVPDPKLQEEIILTCLEEGIDLIEEEM